jgi:cleavage and polyadenylation specificity factor subunit 4
VTWLAHNRLTQTSFPPLQGNCKFGPKCANIHVLPDGRRINYGKNGVTIGVSPIALGSRVNPATYHHTSNSALTNSFMRGDPASSVPPYTAASPYAIPPGGDDRYGGAHQLGRQPSLENGLLPTIDTTYSSNPASAYGSPRDNDDGTTIATANRFGLGLSPRLNGLSVLDAPLPASFDSNGISHAARYGPWPSSVPSKFGLESPSHSLNAAKDGRTSETLKLLHTSAFGSSEHLAGQGGGLHDSGSNGFLMGSSPPIGTGRPQPGGGTGGGAGTPGGGGGGEEYFGRRAMHSSSLRYAKPRLLSSSAPKYDQHEWEPEFLFEEDYVPGALANEVLTPAEKARRGSNTNTLRPPLDDGEGLGMSIGSQSAAAMGISPGNRFGGSPSGVGSPSRWGPLFQRQKTEEEFSDIINGSSSFGAAGGGGNSTSRSMKHAASAFGHVGSPLRNSSLASAMGAELMNSSGSSPAPRPGSGSRSGSGAGESLSALTQQLRQTSLDGGDASPHLHPNAAASRNGGSSVGGPGTSVIGRERERDRALERHVSSGSIGSSGRFTTPIDEEDAAFVFSMEEEEEANSLAAAAARSRKRVSIGAASPLGNGWSYASAVAAGRNGSAGGAAGGNGGAGARDNGHIGTVGGR